MRDGEKGEEREEKGGGGAGVCLQGCVIRPGRFGPCWEQHTVTHPPKKPIQEGRADVDMLLLKSR